MDEIVRLIMFTSLAMIVVGAILLTVGLILVATRDKGVKTLQRYNFEEDKYINCNCRSVPDDNGKWVRYNEVIHRISSMEADIADVIKVLDDIRRR